MAADVAQLECSNNKYYALTFRYIYIDYVLVLKWLMHIPYHTRQQAQSHSIW